MRADSPTPITVPRRSAQINGYASSLSSSDDNLPPSISQRIKPARRRHPRHRDGQAQMSSKKDTTLRLPKEDGDRVLREKKSFDRTKAWAEDAERARVQAEQDELDDVDEEESLGGLTADYSIEGSSSSTGPPRTPSPAASPSRSPDPSLYPTKGPQATPLAKPVLSIDEIVRLHAGTMNSALTAAKDKARKELGMPRIPKGLKRSPVSPMFTLKGKGSSGSQSSGTAAGSTSDLGHYRSRPAIPNRKSSSPTARVHLVPTRSSSFGSPTFLKEFEFAFQQQQEATSSPASPSTPKLVHFTDDEVAEKPSPSLQRKPQRIPPRRSASQSGETPREASTVCVTATDFLPAVTDDTPLAGPRPLPSSARPNSPVIRKSKAPPSADLHELALHLRCAELNHQIDIPRPFPQRPLRVSYAEVGKPDGYPVLIFLGLGCVRYLIALYDQLAQVYGLRLICVDRWGYGKTDQVDPVDRGVIEWSGVIGHIMRKLDISRFQVVAHSAGTPYAMATARRYPDMIRGKMHLMAPWVGPEHDSVLKWAKWLPGSLIKTATSMDHQYNSLKLGKAPKLQYAPIGFDVNAIKAAALAAASGAADDADEGARALAHAGIGETSRLSSSPSLVRRASNVFSSSSTKMPRTRGIYATPASNASVLSLSIPPSRSATAPAVSTSRFSLGLGLGLGGTASRLNLSLASSGDAFLSPRMERSPGLRNLKSLAGMRSVIDLISTPPSLIRSKSSQATSGSAISNCTVPVTPQSKFNKSGGDVPEETDFGLGEGFSSFGTDLALALPSVQAKLDNTVAPRGAESGKPARDRSSTSLASSQPSSSSSSSLNNPITAAAIHRCLTTSTSASSVSTPRVEPHSSPLKARTNSTQAANPTTAAAAAAADADASFTTIAVTLPDSRFPSDPSFVVALQQASHAENEPGTTSEILSIILDKSRRPRGFAYEDVKAPLHVWVGTDDRLIGEKGIQWLESMCGAHVERRRGEGHNLMSSPSILVDLFRCLGEEARYAAAEERKLAKEEEMRV